MEGVRARFRNHGDQSAGVVPILGIDAVGENSELGNGIEIRDDGRAVVHVFFHIAAIYHKPVRAFLLSAHRKVAGIQIARGTERLEFPGRLGDNSGLQRQQVRVTAPVQRYRVDLGTADDFTHLGAGSVDMHRRGRDVDCLCGGAQFHGDIDAQGRVVIKHQARLAIRLETCGLNDQFITADGKLGQHVIPGAIGLGRLLDARIHVQGHHRRVRDKGARGIAYGSGDASRDGGPCDRRPQHQHHERPEQQAGIKALQFAVFHLRVS